MKVKEKLEKILDLNGYKKTGDTWHKARDRKEKNITIKDRHFIVEFIHHPAFREGWSRDSLTLTHKNIDNLDVWV